ncbi:MAG: MATE family efflux transporter [Cellulosilyticaceae bacterium]
MMKGNDMEKPIEYNKMADTPMMKLLLTMSLPAMLSMMIQALYNIVDSLFVAQIGEKALAAVSLAFPIQTMIIAVAVGTGIGLNSLISRSLGEKNQEKASLVADHGVLLAICSWIVFMIFGLFFSRSFFEMFTDDIEVIQMGTTYISTVTIFSVGAFIQINIEKIFQGTGNMVYPMIMQIIGAVTNIILDPIFIFGWFGIPKMGVKGAAIATVIGQFTAMAVSIYLITKRSKNIKISLKHFKFDFKIIKEIYMVGFPAIVMQSIMSIVVIVLNNLLIGFSQTAVAVMGIYFKVQSFIFMPVFGLTQGALPIIGYSYGAKNKTRLMTCFKQSIIIVILMMGMGTVLFNLLPVQIIQMFNGTEEMLAIGVSALKIISIGFIFAGISIVISTLFQAVGLGIQSLLISIIRQVVMLIPLAWILSKSLGVVGVWWSFPIAEFVAVILSVIIMAIQYRLKITKMTDVE